MAVGGYEVTACVLLHRDHRWLLGIRAADVADSPGRLGLIGGHVETDRDQSAVLEATARREVLEEVGLDLADVQLFYLESELFHTDAGGPQVTVTFVAHAPPGADPVVAAPAELVEVGWWSTAEAAADPRCPLWLPDLLERAGLHLNSGEG